MFILVSSDGIIPNIYMKLSLMHRSLVYKGHVEVINFIFEL